MTNYLIHHGVKGQSWGVRNGPPYPLNAKGRADLQKQRVDKYVKSGKAHVDNLKSYSVAGLSTMTTSTGEEYISGLMHGHDFDWQEVTNINGEYQPIAKALKNDSDGWLMKEVLYNERNLSKDGRVTDNALYKCNRDFGAPGTTQNCAKCSATLELMSRYGLDISAGRQTYPSSSDAASFWFKDAERVDYSYEDSQKMLTSYGKNSSGTLSIQYPNNAGGHAMHWTVDNSGKFEIQDGQNNRRFNSVEEMMNTYGGDKSEKITTFRLDTCEPNWDNMASDSVIRYDDSYSPYGDVSKVKNRFSKRVVDTW